MRNTARTLRLTLILGSTPGNDTRFSEEKIRASRNFANKLWNAARFVMMNLPGDFAPGLPRADRLDLSDKWVLSTLNHLAAAVTEHLEKFELGLAAQKVQDFIWEVYCDWYIEIAKVRLNAADPAEADAARKVLICAVPGAEAAAPVHALYHRGNLPGAARRGREHYGGAMAGVLQRAGFCRRRGRL